MPNIVNISNVSDYSGTTPTVTPSNPVTTVVSNPPPPVFECTFCIPEGLCNPCEYIRRELQNCLRKKLG